MRHNLGGARMVAMAALGSLAVTGLAATASASPVTRVAVASASPDWARLADRVLTPVLNWVTCQQVAQCVTAELPLDYQDPHGATIKLALLRIKAEDPKHRLGTIFVHPGGPGDSAGDSASVFAALARLSAPGGAGSGRAALVKALEHLRSALQNPSPEPVNHLEAFSLEAFSGIACADGLQAVSAASWPAAVRCRAAHRSASQR